MRENAKTYGIEKEVNETYETLLSRYPENGIEWAAIFAQKSWGI